MDRDNGTYCKGSICISRHATGFLLIEQTESVYFCRIYAKANNEMYFASSATLGCALISPSQLIPGARLPDDECTWRWGVNGPTRSNPLMINVGNGNTVAVYVRVGQL